MTTTLRASRVQLARGAVPADLARHVVALPGSDLRFATARTAELLEKRVRRGLLLDPIELDVTDAAARLHREWAALVSEPLPDPVLDEVLLRLASRPADALEFMGRGRIPREVHLPGERASMETVDIAGGRRCYLFRKLAPGDDPRITRMREQFASFRTWLRDDGARLVVSLSGGGFRLFATTPALKVVEALLDGDRGQVDEVWGCSGGALAGYVFAAGHRLSLLDTFGYDLYNGRLPHLVSGSLASLARGTVRAEANRLRGRPVVPEMVEWLMELDAREPRERRRAPIPFYALATSTSRGGPFALGAPEHCDPAHPFQVPCDPWLGVAASTAVPFLVRAVRGIGADPREHWIDGSVSDETPLYLPFAKWQRDRELRPRTTPDRLKILLVHLNLRSSESGVVTALSRFRPTRRTLVRAARLVDTVLDTKTSMVIDMVARHPRVEILCAKLSLGWLGLHRPTDIARAIRTGRTVESWSFTRHPEAPAALS